MYIYYLDQDFTDNWSEPSKRNLTLDFDETHELAMDHDRGWIQKIGHHGASYSLWRW